MPLEIAEGRIDPDITVIELTGKLALGRESQRIETLVEELTRGGVRKVVMDMTKVDYIDSAGIGLVALAAGRMRENAGQLVAVAPEGRVLQLLKLTQVDTIVTVRATVAEAAGVFGLRQPPAVA